MEVDQERTGRYIRFKRKELHYSQHELASKLYVEPQTISKWERGKGMPDPNNVIKLADIFGCTVDNLYNPPEIKESDLEEEDLIEEQPENKEKTNLPIVMEILKSNETQDEDIGKFKFSELLHKNKIKARISKIFGLKYESVYTEKFLFKGLFKKRTLEDYEITLTQGMFKNDLNHKVIGIEAPWLYIRVFFFLLICAVIAFVTSFVNRTPAYAVTFGTLFAVIPLLVFLYESNFARDISIFTVGLLFVSGGLLSILFALLLFSFFPVNDLIAVVAIAPFVEEIAKFLIAVFFVKLLKPKNLLAGLLIGFSVGAGFTVFENIQYGYDAFIGGLSVIVETNEAYLVNFEDGVVLSILSSLRRGFSDLFIGHHYWTAISTGMYVLFKKETNFNVKDLFNWKTMLALIYVMMLHLMWNGSGFTGIAGEIILQLIVSLLSTYTLIMLINLGIAQVKVLQIYNEVEDSKDEEIFSGLNE